MKLQLPEFIEEYFKEKRREQMLKNITMLQDAIFEDTRFINHCNDAIADAKNIIKQTTGLIEDTVARKREKEEQLRQLESKLKDFNY